MVSLLELIEQIHNIIGIEDFQVISIEDYQKAIKSINFLNRAFLDFRKRINDKYTEEIKSILNQEEYLKLSEYLLDLADELFVESPTDQENKRFQDNLRNIQVKLNAGTVESATQTIALIEESIKTHHKRIAELEKTGFYSRHTFCLFWALWFLLDEIVRSPNFPGNYEEFVAKLYGIISPAIRSKEAILCLAKYSEEIYKEVTG